MIPPVFVIACKELPERWNACEEHLREMKVPATFIRSVHGRTWGLETTKEFEPGKRVTPGHVGLCLGAWFAWQCAYQMVTDDDQPIIFLEDDVCVPPLWNLQVNDVQIELRYHLPDWDLVYLGLSEVEPRVWHKISERVGSPNSRLCRMEWPFGTHAIMLRRRALPILLDHMTVAERNLDQQLYARVLKPGLLKWCAVLPSIITQRTFDYTGTGKPAWQASTLNHDDPIANGHGLAATETELKQRHGFLPGSASHCHPTKISAMSKLLIDPYPCIYRGEPLDDNGEGTNGTGKLKSVPLSMCARLCKACHSKTGVTGVLQWASSGVRDAIDCETCTLRSAMTARTKRDALPLPEGHFNPSILQYNGKLILATRDSWGHSKVALWELFNTERDWSGEWRADPIGSYASANKDVPRLEDPRLFIDPEGHLCAALSLPDGYPPKYVKMGYVRFAKDLSGIEDTIVFASPKQSLYEKNWQPFVDEGELRWVYGMKPYMQVMGQKQTWTTENHLAWSGGVIRGGAAPVLMLPHVRRDTVGVHGSWHRTPVYYSFYHGCLKRLEGSVYTIGCAVFDAEPPYRILRQTAAPFKDFGWPDQPAEGENVVKRYVLFPGGAVPYAGHWFIACGVDDSYARIVRVPFDTVEQALTDKHEDAPTTGLRETSMALGTSVEDIE